MIQVLSDTYIQRRRLGTLRGLSQKSIAMLGKTEVLGRGDKAASVQDPKLAPLKGSCYLRYLPSES